MTYPHSIKHNPSKSYSVKNLAPGELELLIYDEIGDSPWSDDGITAKRIAKDLEAAGNIHTINVRINSPGGRVFDALGITSRLLQHPARVRVFIDGLAASSASVVAMAGSKPGSTIFMSSSALLMIHLPWSMCIGFAKDMRHEAELLDKIEGSIIKTYMDQIRKSHGTLTEKQLGDYMEAESWFNADQSLALGLIDTISEPLQAAASATFDLSKFKYRNAPKMGKNHDKTLDLRLKIARMNMQSMQIRAEQGR
jgi:ATP-dependent protease ClpP protease subunit